MEISHCIKHNPKFFFYHTRAIQEGIFYWLNIRCFQILISVTSIIEAVASGQSESNANFGDSQMDSSCATIETQPDTTVEGAAFNVFFGVNFKMIWKLILDDYVAVCKEDFVSCNY